MSAVGDSHFYTLGCKSGNVALASAVPFDDPAPYGAGCVRKNLLLEGCMSEQEVGIGTRWAVPSSCVNLIYDGISRSFVIMTTGRLSTSTKSLHGQCFVVSTLTSGLPASDPPKTAALVPNKEPMF